MLGLKRLFPAHEAVLERGLRLKLALLLKALVRGIIGRCMDKLFVALELLSLRWAGGLRRGRWHVGSRSGKHTGQGIKPRLELCGTQRVLLALLGKLLLGLTALGVQLLDAAIDKRDSGSVIGDIGVLPL
jgi:hypothetical protein